MTPSLTLRAAVLSAALFLAFVLLWQLGIQGSGPAQQMDPEYAKLMGATATQAAISSGTSGTICRSPMSSPRFW
jgi:hypothetical protein